MSGHSFDQAMAVTTIYVFPSSEVVPCCCPAVNPVAYAVSADMDIFWQGFFRKGGAWSQEIGSGAGQSAPAASLPGGSSGYCSRSCSGCHNQVTPQRSQYQRQELNV